MRTTSFWLVALLAVVATPAFAQTDDQRVRVSFGGGISAGAIDGEASVAASAGYRFSNRWSFDVELTAADGSDRFENGPIRWAAGAEGNVVRASNSNTAGTPSISARSQLQNVGLIIAPIPSGIDDDGETILAMAGFRYEMPTQSARFRPYLSAGLGVARTEQTIRLLPGTVTVAPQRPGLLPAPTPIDFDDSFSHTSVAGSAGVGASLRVFKGLSVDLNARYFRLDRSRNLGSFGGGVSYRF